MKKLLHKSYGTKFQINDLKLSEEELIEFFESLPLNQNLDDVTEELLIEYLNVNKAYKFKYHGEIYIYVLSNNPYTKYKELQKYQIVEVDTSKLWMIDVYDGYEDVRYFELSDDNMLVEIE